VDDDIGADTPVQAGTQESGRIAGDEQAEIAPGTHDLPQVLSHFRRVDVDRADEFEGGLVEQQANNAGANRAYTVLDDTNLAFHGREAERTARRAKYWLT
jgi:hypothetical protein